MTGRPLEFTEQIAARICDLAADGKRPREIGEIVAREIGRAEPFKPGTIADWLYRYPNFARRYARARDVGLDVMADELLDIPDSEADVQRARLKSENLKWYLGKLAPKKYGDRLDVSISKEISITDALTEARARRETLEARPVRDQLAHQSTQAIDLPSEAPAGLTDSESDPDPFS